jgi:hypothetical protein
MKRDILAGREELQTIRGRIGRKPFDAFYEAQRQRCALILESAPITEMNWQTAWSSGTYNAALTAARGAQGRILDLAIADAIDPNQAYRSRAVEELMNLVRWSTWVDPSRTNLLVDLCTAEAAVGAVVGLDWLWEFLQEEQRRTVLDTLRDRVLRPYLKSVSDGAWWYSAVNHWNAVINSACALTGLALDDEFPEAAKVYQAGRKGLKPFFNDLGEEGGWDEGIGYWGYAMRYVLLLCEGCARLLDDQKLFQQRGMAATGLFPIYFSPNGRPASFGDSAEMPLHGTLYLLARYFKRSEIVWWLDTYSVAHDPNTIDWSRAGMALLFRPERDGVKEPKLEPMKVFHEIGWAALADTWPRPNFYVAFKTGDLATSHAQRDMNSLQLQVDGEMMLIDLGHPPDAGSSYFSRARSGFYEVQARAHNTILVGEEDQRPDAQGSIVDSQTGPDYRWVLGEAGQACGENVTFYRHVILLTNPKDGRGHTLVVLDELNQPSPEHWELFWHTGGKIDLAAGEMSGRIAGRKAHLNFALTSTLPAQTQTGHRVLDYGRADFYLRLSAGGVGQSYIASVFSREPLPGGVQLKPVGKGGVMLTFAQQVLEFRSAKKHLTLERVSSSVAE